MISLIKTDFLLINMDLTSSTLMIIEFGNTSKNSLIGLVGNIRLQVILMANSFLYHLTLQLLICFVVLIFKPNKKCKNGSMLTQSNIKPSLTVKKLQKAELDKFYTKKYLNTTHGSNGTSIRTSFLHKFLPESQSERTSMIDILLINIKLFQQKVILPFVKT